MPQIALDATYSVGPHLTGVGVYSREILNGLAGAHPDCEFLWCYRPHRFLRSVWERLPANCRRRVLHEGLAPRGADLFHGMNQRLPRAPFRAAVTTFHDLFVLTDEFSTPEFRRRFEQQARDAAATSDLIIAVSAFTASQVETLLGFPRERIRVVHHGVRFQTRPELPREKIVLHTGAIQRRKNIARLVRAFAALDGWRLVLAGSFGYAAGEALDAIQASPRRDEIRLLGYVSDDELQDLYGRAAIFAFPSLGEGFGMPVLEAMSAGAAVLTSKVSALPEVAGDAALLVDPFNEEEIAARLRELAKNEELRRELGERGRARAAAFTWEAGVARTWTVYSELLGATAALRRERSSGPSGIFGPEKST